VPTDGFYEWAKVGSEKQPHGWALGVVARRGEQRIESFTIIVTVANELCRPIHDRMPVILHPDTWETWLTTKDAETASALFAAVLGEPDGDVSGQQARREREER
jgi:putative SOS response-associated peptidase YedK